MFSYPIKTYTYYHWLAVFFNQFVNLILGCVPPVLLLGGGLALYLGFDELKDTWKNEKGKETEASKD